MTRYLLVFLVGALILTSSTIGFSQAVEICNDGKDNNGNGIIDCAEASCTFPSNIEKGCRCFDGNDNDGDTKIDATDTDCSLFYQHVQETCNDGKDNNANGIIDCNELSCTFPANVEKGCRCYDTLDNDGDGKVDQADTECATYFGLAFVGQGSNCSITPPAGPGGPFATLPPTTTQQNTADTPAKVVVGDVNGDGFPDAVVCSKWNSTVQVIATATASGFDPGDIMSDFRTPGKNGFWPDGGGAGSAWIFEYEVLIADIDKDGKSEIFAVASKRGGSPNNAPFYYALLGFKWATGTLNRIWTADLGPDRPGAPGIADFDGDGKGEVYLKNRIYAAETGFKLADGGGNWDLSVNSGPVAANITGDAKLELICGPIIYSVPSMATRNAVVPLTVIGNMNALPGPDWFPKGFNDLGEYGKDQVSTTSTADFNGDGFLDVLMTGAINCTGLELPTPCPNPITTIFFWDFKNGTMQTFAPPDTSTPNPNGWMWGTGRINLGDATGDGKTDALFVAGNQLYCLGLVGGVLSQQWVRTINDSKSGILSVTVYDFNNDGKPEVVYRDSQRISMVDGPTGQTELWWQPCQSHTWTEGPVIADIDGNGGTDICVTCYTNTSFNINADIQQQSLGQTRLYYSSTNSWLPTRKVWNQHPYYVTNINDNLTLPYPQIDPALVFSNAPCPSGLPGPQRPLNIFMNQVPRLSATGCPVFPAPDLTFTGDNPGAPGVDSDGDGIYTPAVVVTPPICGDVTISAYFNIINSGDLPISDVVPVAFFNGDPRTNPVVATKLFSTTLNVSNLQVGQKMVTPTVSFPGPGTVFQLYIVLYTNGNTLPLVLAGPSANECSITNNIYNVTVTPDPFTSTVEKISDNFKCAGSAPNTGHLRAHIFKGGVEFLDYSQYAFQWYNGIGTSSPIAGATAYNITGIPEGNYTVVVTNTAKGCAAQPASINIVRLGNDPTIVFNTPIDQTNCTPPNGSLTAHVSEGDTGYTFSWFDVGLSSVGSGLQLTTVTGLSFGSYIVKVSKDGCVKDSPPITVGGPKIPDAQAQVLQHVVSCATPTSGIITAQAFFNSALENQADYSFNWYFHNPAAVPPASKRGSILPPAYGTGATRTGLPIGYYEAEVKNNITKCVSLIGAVVQVLDSRVIPTVTITELAPQTACDPALANGVLSAQAFVGAVPQNPAGYTFEWFKGDNTLPMFSHTTVSGVNGNVANKVTGGGEYYTVRATIIGTGCTNTNKYIISENKQVPVITPSMTPNSICNPAIAGVAYNGTFTATVSFPSVATPNYTFTWHNGPLVTDPVIAVGNNQLPTLSQRNGGYYTVEVKETTLGCSAVPKSVEILNTPIIPVLTKTSVGSTNCTPALANGTASVVTVDGVAVGTATGYTYAWTGPVAPAFPVTVATNNSNAAQLIKLQGGLGYDYTVLVTNLANGCQKSEAVNVADVKVLPVITLAKTDNSICDPSKTVPAVPFNGTVTATVTNPAVPPTYTYAFGAGMNAGVTTGNVYSQLNGGLTLYTGTATHTPTGCVSSVVSVQVFNIPGNPALGPDETASTNCTPALADGIAEILTVDGIAVGLPAASNYTYAWTGPVAPAFPVNVATNNSNTAKLIKVQGGTNYDYTVLVTNRGNGCQTTQAVNVTDGKVLPIITLAKTDNSICDPSKTVPAVPFNGTVTATVTNPAVPPTYTFTFGAGMNAGVTTGNVYSQLNGGLTLYTGTATHTPTGCVSSVVTKQVFNIPGNPVLGPDETASTNCTPALADGIAEILTVDAIAVGLPAASNYTYAWTGPVAPAFPVNVGTNNSNTAKLIKVQGGTNYDYTVLVTNRGNGCQTTQAVNVTDAKVLPVITLAKTDNSICDPSKTLPAVPYNGTVTATVTNPAVPPTYTFTFGAGMNAGVTTGNVYSQLNGGLTLYTATATHTPTGCVSSVVTKQVFNIPGNPVLGPDETASTNCTPALANGIAEILTVDAIAVGLPAASNYTYAWTGPAAPAFPVNVGTNNSNTAKLIKVQGGTNYDYTVLVTNRGNGCQTTQAVNVTDAKVLPLLTVTPTPNTVCNKAKATGGIFDGRVDVVVTNIPGGGAVTDYLFTWNGGPSNPPDGNGVVAATDLNFGTYTVTAQHNPTGCTSILHSPQVTDGRVLPIISMAQTASTNCPGGVPDGIASVTNVVPNGVGVTYDYKWFNGTTTTDPPGPITLASALTTNTYSAVQGGIVGAVPIQYTVEVTLLTTGCPATNTIAVDDDSEVPIIDVPLTLTDNTSCKPAPDKNGEATVASFTYRGANVLPANWGDYTFEWSPTPAGAVQGPPETYAGLGAGDYFVTVEHNISKCKSNPVMGTIADVLFYPEIKFTEVPQTSCDPGAPNGKVFAAVDEDGAGPGPDVTIGYTFVWQNRGNPLGPIGPAPNFVAPNGIDQLAADIFYEVTVTGISSGCSKTGAHLLSQNIINPLVTLGNVQPQTNCNAPNGTATATVTTPAPTTTFTYYWLRELPLQTTNDGPTVKNTVITNSAPAFFNRQSAVAAATDIYSGTVNGRYTVVVEDNFNKCLSEPVSVDILDHTQSNIQITFDLADLPTACTSSGKLKINAVRIDPPPTLEFDFDIFRGGPTNTTLPIDYYSNPTNPPLFAAPKIETLANVPSGASVKTTSGLINSDLYTVVATDDFGCKSHESFFLPFQDAHTIDDIVTNVTTCNTDNGAIAFRTVFPTTGPLVNVQNQSDYQFTLYAGGLPTPGNEVAVPGITGPYGAETNPGDWPQVPASPPAAKETCGNGVDNDGDGKADAIDEDCIGRFTVPGLPVGFYVLKIEDKATLCDVYESVEIKLDARPPVIDLVGSPAANTSCVEATSDGSAVISITRNPADLVAVAPTYTMAINPVPLLPFAPGPFGIGNRTITGLKPDTYEPAGYEITVTSSNGCETIQNVTIPDQPVVGQLASGDIVATDAEYCDALLEQSARVTVNDVKLSGGASDDIRDYTFTWYSDAALTTTIFTANGSTTALTGGDELINQVPLVTSGTVPAGTVTVGDYYVRANKFQDVFSASGGVGCTTAPFTVNIQSDFVSPQIILTPTADSSCDPAFFEGKIEVDVTTTGPGAGATYDYTWAPTGGGGQPVNSLANSGVSNMQLNINDGTFTLTAENNTTGCDASLPTTLLKEQPPTITVLANVTPVSFCVPFNGKIDGLQIIEDGITPGTVSDYDYVWYRTTAGGTLVLDGPNIATDDTQLTLTTFPGISVDAYFVKAIRKDLPGAIGVGCESTFLRKDILDDRVNPQISFATVSNSSCDLNFDGQITVTATTQVGSAGAGSGYNFVWTSDPDGVGANYFATNSATDNEPSPLITPPTDRIGPISSTVSGQYAITVTNKTTQCFVNGTVDILQSTVPMAVTNVSSTPVDLCAAGNTSGANGTATVVTVTPAGASFNYQYLWDDDPLMGSPMAPGVKNPAVTRTNLDIGTFYVKAINDAVLSPATPGVSGSGCETAPLPFTIDDLRVIPTLTISTISSTACDGNFDGQITVQASTAVPSGYNYVWTNDPDGPLLAYFASNSPTNNHVGSLTTLNTDKIGAISPTIPGQYSITATNFNTQCSVDGTIDILQSTVPMSVTTVNTTNVDLCLAGNGSAANGTATVVTITEIPGPGSPPNYEYLWSSNADMSSPFAPGVKDPAVTRTNLDFGTFYVKAIKDAVVSPVTPGISGSGCETAPLPFTINDLRVLPTLAISTISNTACDGNFDGQITVQASTASGPGAPQGYNYVWTNDPDGLAGPLYSASNSPTNNHMGALTTLNTDLIGAISPTVPGQYAIRVTSFGSGCFVDGTIDILQSTVPMSVTTVTTTNVDLCLVGTNGSGANGTATVVTITEIPGPGSPPNYEYLWSSNADMSLPFAPGVKDPAVTRTALDFGTFYVKAIKDAVVSPVTPGISGSGCETAPLPFTILDRRVLPTIGTTTIANTSCDGNFDGQITVNAATLTGNYTASNYDFLWQSDPGGAVVVNDAIDVPSPHVTGPPDLVGPGAYVIRAVNRASQCFADAPADLLYNPQPLNIVTVTKTEQLICFPDGSITVTALSTAGPASYSYEWYKDDPASAPLVDNLANPIDVNALVPGTAATQFPTMGFGTYYVRATKTDGLTPGSGCSTPPFRIDILDLHKDPRTQLAYTPNSSCDNLNPNAIVTAAAAEQNGANGDTYSFAWTLNAGVVPPVTTQTDTNNSSQLDNAFDGNYSLTIVNTTTTGCQFSSSIVVNIDLSVSLPNIINVNTVDPVDCLASGSAAVASVSIGGGPAITGPALTTNFSYEWYSATFTPPSLLPTTTPTIATLSPQSYFVLVQDNATKCKSGPREVVITDDDIIYPVVAIEQTARQISCTAITGTAALLATGDGQTDANPSYTFTWYPSLDLSGTSFATTSAITNLLVGDYSVDVKNLVSGCSASALFIVPNEAPAFTPQIATSGAERTLCVGTDGSVLTRVINISPDYPFPLSYTVDLFLGPTANLSGTPLFPNIPPQPGFPTNFLQSGLLNDTYTVRVTDNNTGCFATLDEVVLDKRTAPVPAIIEENPLTNCDPAKKNGQLSASADGGKVGGYTFDWYAGTTVASPPGTLLVSNNKLIAQTMGSYVVRVTKNITGCFADLSGAVTDKTITPPVPTPEVVLNRTNCLTPNGWVTATVGGLTANYIFDWYDGTTATGGIDFTGNDYQGLDIGDYTVTATDVITGCVSPPGTVPIIDQRVIPEFNFETTPSYCSDVGKPQGAGTVFLVLTTVGVFIDDVTWTDTSNNTLVGNGLEVGGLFPGFYQADAITSDGCSNTGIAEVKTEIGPYNGMSVNGDAANDNFIIDCITNFPNNNVKIFNRSGIKVFEVNGYDNAEISFDGEGEKGLYLQGTQLPVGTYFYIIDKRDGSKPVAGYLELTR